MNQTEASNLVKGILEAFNANYRGSTVVYIKNCITYDFGWYFEYGVRGEMLAGGPDFGIFVHNEGLTYALHYVGTPWDTGINETLTVTHGVGHPSKYSVRYFNKKVKVWQAIRNDTSITNRSFVTDKGYDIIGAVKWLKLDLCMTREKAIDWIATDTRQDLNFINQGYNKEFREQVCSEWTKIINTGLYDMNWLSYFEKKIF